MPHTRNPVDATTVYDSRAWATVLLIWFHGRTTTGRGSLLSQRSPAGDQTSKLCYLML